MRTTRPTCPSPEITPVRKLGAFCALLDAWGQGAGSRLPGTGPTGLSPEQYPPGGSWARCWRPWAPTTTALALFSWHSRQQRVHGGVVGHRQAGGVQTGASRHRGAGLRQSLGDFLQLLVNGQGRPYVERCRDETGRVLEDLEAEPASHATTTDAGAGASSEAATRTVQVAEYEPSKPMMTGPKPGLPMTCPPSKVGRPLAVSGLPPRARPAPATGWNGRCWRWCPLSRGGAVWDEVANRPRPTRPEPPSGSRTHPRPG